MATAIQDVSWKQDAAPGQKIVAAIPPVPDINVMHGPITRRILSRFYIMQAAWFLIGIPLGLMTIAVFAAIMFIWWARGVVIAPPAAVVVSGIITALWTGNDQALARWNMPRLSPSFKSMQGWR